MSPGSALFFSPQDLIMDCIFFQVGMFPGQVSKCLSFSEVTPNWKGDSALSLNPHC